MCAGLALREPAINESSLSTNYMSTIYGGKHRHLISLGFKRGSVGGNQAVGELEKCNYHVYFIDNKIAIPLFFPQPHSFTLLQQYSHYSRGCVLGTI